MHIDNEYDGNEEVIYLYFLSPSVTNFSKFSEFSHLNFLRIGSCTVHSVRYLYNISKSQKLQLVVKSGITDFNIGILSCLTLFLDLIIKDGLHKKIIIVHVDYEKFGIEQEFQIRYKILQLYLYTFNQLYTNIYIICNN